MRQIAVILFFITLPFTSVFSYNEYISLSIATVAVIALLLSLRFSMSSKFVRTSYSYNLKFYLFMILIMALTVLISSLLSGAIDEPIRFNHILARLLFCALIFAMLLIGLTVSELEGYKLIKIIYWSYAGVFVVCLADAANMYGFTSMQLPRASVETLLTTYGSHFRIRGPAEEPGHLAAFFSATLPIVTQWSKRPYLTVVSLSLLVFVLTFSFAFLIWVLAFIGVSISINLIASERDYKGKIKSVLGIIMVVLVAIAMGYIVYNSDIMQSKLKGSSYDDRVYSYKLLKLYADSASNYLFGLGPGVYKGSGFSQPTNFLMSTLVELGLSGLLVLLAMLYFNIKMLIVSRNFYLASGSIAFIVFLNTISNYFYPFYCLPLLYIMFIPKGKASTFLTSVGTFK
jgi:hypothetical protein